MSQLQGPVPNFAGLYADPSIERMLADLSDHEFEHFVAYVFEQAGYVVEDTAGQRGPGLDLKLYNRAIAPGNLHAGVQVKHYRSDRAVTAPEVGGLRNGIAQNGGVPGYFVTTSSFVGPALIQANQVPRIWPIDGDHFLRYITYVRGTRPRVSTSQSVPPPGYPLAPIPPEALFLADALVRRPVSETKVLTLANHKGGVGKTTSALNIALGLAAQNHQVLLVDMDAQANLTRLLPHPHAGNVAEVHLGDYFAGTCALKDLVRQTQFPNVWLIPSSHDLTRSDTGMAAGPEAESRFARDLHADDVIPPPQLAATPFDWIVIDTGPSMGFFTRSALAASHFVLIPIAPGVFADTGLDLLIQTVETMTALTNAPIAILGGLVTQWKQDKLNEQLLVDARVHLGDQRPLFKAKVPYDKPNIEKSHIQVGQGKKKGLFDHKCAAAQAYTEAVNEILSRT